MSRPSLWRSLAAFVVGATALTTIAGTALSAGAASRAATGADSATMPHNEFIQTNLVSDRTDQGAQIVDPNLLNPWGLAFSATSPLWVANNNSDTATIYFVPAGGTSVTKAGLTVTMPGGRASTGDGPSPTGQVFNGSAGFTLTTATATSPAAFIFDSEGGQITGWSGKTGALVEFSSPTAVYKGLTIATTNAGTFLYAANFNAGTVDVFNSSWQQVQMLGDFHDPHLPADYAPFGIQEIDGLIYVTYAEQDAAKHDDVPGPGHGFIDIYTTDGLLVKRLVSHGLLNSPWGLTRAPAGFGPFGGDLLVGNFRDGRINVFDQFSGEFMGQLRDQNHQPITIENLWGLDFGTASTGGTNTLLFSAGINDEADGLLGSINAAP
jgi:uncharacterized protein (TIGR03118 family)